MMQFTPLGPLLLGFTVRLGRTAISRPVRHLAADKDWYSSSDSVVQLSTLYGFAVHRSSKNPCLSVIAGTRTTGNSSHVIPSQLAR